MGTTTFYYRKKKKIRKQQEERIRKNKEKIKEYMDKNKI